MSKTVVRGGEEDLGSKSLDTCGGAPGARP